MTPILELQDLSFRYEGGLPGEKVLDALPCAKLIASHDLDFIYDTCDRVLLLHHGQLAADGPAREILCDKTLLEKCELELPLRWQRDF